jgi:UDP-N-acetylglucosamine 2-epimerase (non-hydrolysing)
MLNILNVVGARPNFMKVAPLFREYAKHSGRIRATLVHTEQHYDDAMSREFFSELSLPTPTHSLGIGSGSHAEQTGRVMVEFEKILLQERPNLVLVVGDVNSTLACALVAAKSNVQIAHVEAGLRSFDRAMPEEINRLVTDALTDFFFTTSEDADNNLKAEGVAPHKIHRVGNTMIDTLLLMRDRLDTMPLPSAGIRQEEQYVYMTLHRPSNVDTQEILSGICDAVENIQQSAKIIWPLHPRTRKKLVEHSLMSRMEALGQLVMVEPVRYLESLSLMKNAAVVLTDSGGIQEETTVLGVPCLTLRNNTERPITVSEGTNELVGTDASLIVRKAMIALSGGGKRGAIPILWDGHASERIVQVLLGVQ